MDLPDATVQRITDYRTIVTGPLGSATVLGDNPNACWCWAWEHPNRYFFTTPNGTAKTMAIEKAKQMVGCRSLAAFMEYS